ncbi:MAG: N-6 DNA methylase [Nanoarchaeota archaeon]|nr:N-6 DNA methylase [Nanoarchaeota archaeon]MBU1988920.1 N-6 DNA methylase [Nanoarchaeota archaeon]
MVRETKLQETHTRKKIDKVLENLGWITDEENPDCNVTTEVPKLLKQKETLNRGEGDYFLYKSGTDEIIGIIETKRPNESIKQALQQGIDKYAEPLNVPVVFATDGSIIRTYHLKDKQELKKDGVAITNILSEQELLKFQKTSNIITPVEVKYTKQQLIKIFDRANKLLRKDGLREGVERFTEFANLLFMKMISEIEDIREKQGLPRRFEKRYCWTYFKDWEGQRILDYINDTILPRLADRYNHSGDVFNRTLNIKNPDTIKEIVDKLSKLNLSVIESDVKGDAFEYFLKESVSVGNDLGEYFTPRHIVKLMVQLVNPVFGETIYDCSCGTGGFLIEAYKHLWEKCKHTEENVEKLQEHTIYGRELTGTAKIAKMNMILAGDGHTNIVQMDSLSKPLKEEHDVVLTNFPFAQETDYGNLYNMNTKDANGVFLKHIIMSLKKEGKAGVVCFHGVLFDSRYKDIREYMLKNCNLEAVIKLHRFTFQPYANVDTSILIFKKGEPTKKVWFFEVEEDGFRKTGSNKGRPPIDKNDFTTLKDIWDLKPETEKSWSADISEIEKNDWVLSSDKYKPKHAKATKYEIVELEAIADPKLGKTPSKKDYNGNRDGFKILKYRDVGFNGEINWDVDDEGYISEEIANEKGLREIQDGDIIVVASGHSPESIGTKSCIVKIPSHVKKPVYYVGELMRIRLTSKEVLPEYLLNYLKTREGYKAIHECVEGVHLVQGRAKKMKIIKPSLEIQKKIVEDLRKEQKKIYEALKQIQEAKAKQKDIIERIFK